MKMKIELYLPSVTIFSLEDLERVVPKSYHLKKLEHLPRAHKDVVKRIIHVDRNFHQIKGYEVSDYAESHFHRETRYITIKELDNMVTS